MWTKNCRVMSSTGSYEHLPLANGDVAPVRVRVDGRAKRISIKVEKVGGLVILTAPTEKALPEARRFMSTRTNWIAARRAAMHTRLPFEHGAETPFLGRMRRIEHAPDAADPARIDGDRLVIAGRKAKIADAVQKFMKVEAKRRLESAAHDHAAKIGRSVANVSVRDQKTRWGSCAASGRLSFSWRLVMAPESVLSYVAAHEVAHLKHMHHGPAFWRLVAKLDPDWEAAEAWLKEDGPSLRRYG